MTEVCGKARAAQTFDPMAAGYARCHYHANIRAWKLLLRTSRFLMVRCPHGALDG